MVVRTIGWLCQDALEAQEPQNENTEAVRLPGLLSRFGLRLVSTGDVVVAPRVAPAVLGNHA
jgi:hypothetical protein